MIKVDSIKEFKLGNKSFSEIKNIDLKDIGFYQLSDSNIFRYKSDEYKILNYRIKPELTFKIRINEENIHIELNSISINNLSNIFKLFNLKINLYILPDKDYCKAKRFISLSYESKNKFLSNLSKKAVNKILHNLIEKISSRFDKKLIKKVLNNFAN
tara:strand:- start:492 stop:962 length:471 start_codon:yes stop_codon:yes gene_type:complete